MSLVVPHRWLRNCVASPLSPGQHFAAAFWQALLGRHIHRGEKVHGHVAENSHVDGVVQQLRDTAGRYQCFCVTASAYLCASVSLHRCGSASSDYVFLSLCALAPLSLCASVFYVSVFLSLGRCVSVASCRVSLRVCVFVGFCMCVCARVWVSLRGCVSVCLCLYVLAYLYVSFCVSVFGVSFVCVYVWLCVWVRECIMSFRAPVSARLPVSEPLCPCASVSSSRCVVVRV